MTPSERVDAEFADRSVSQWGMRLYQPAVAIDLVRRCRQLNVRVLGIDAFLNHSKGIEPSLEHSIDFTNEHNRALSLDVWRHAEAFIRDRVGAPLLFEFVLRDPD